MLSPLKLIHGYEGNLGSEVMKRSRWKRFGKYVCMLFGRRNMMCAHSTSHDLFTNKVAIRPNMLHTIVKDWIFCNTNGGLVVTVNLWPKVGRPSASVM